MFKFILSKNNFACNKSLLNTILLKKSQITCITPISNSIIKNFHKITKPIEKKSNTNKEDSQPSIKKESEKASITKIFKYIKPYYDGSAIKRLLIYSLILTIASKGLISLSPYFLKLTINSVLEKSTIITPLIFLVVSGIARIFGIGLQEYRQIILNKVSAMSMIAFSKDMMANLMKLNFSYLKSNSETVTNSFNKSLQGIEKFNRFVLGNVMSNTVEIVIISIMLYTLMGPKYFLNTIATYAIYLYFTRKISQRRLKYIRDKWNTEISSENKIFDIIYNIETVKYFQREETESENFAQTVKLVREKDEKVISSLSFLNNVQNLIITIGMITNLSMGIYDCFYLGMTPGDLVMLQAIFMQMVMPLNFMGMLMREIEETRINLQYAIDMIKNKEKTLQAKKDLVQFHFQQGKIEFKNVNFGYTLQNMSTLPSNSNNPTSEPKKLILNDFSTVFEPNTVNAIVGYSGQGKSTIFNLIYKLYEPTQGHILVDGQDIATLDVESYRKYLTIYPQNGHLFNDSILMNILYGKPEATMEEVEGVAKSLDINKIINSLDGKYFSNVGTLGSKLSGGEKQRILLARTFLRNSNIFLLDEPTSSLDSHNESLVFDLLMQNKKNKTILISSHKLTTISQCDVIYVLNKGSLVERGDHNTLMRNGGLYYEIFKNKNGDNF